MTSPAGFFAKTVDRIRRWNPPPDLARPLFRPAPAELVLWLLFAAVTLTAVWFHEPWRDEAQGFLIVRDNTLPGLVLHMRDESQFLLWFLFTWPFVRLLGVPIFGVNLLHWGVSCATAFLVLRRAPFRLLTRAAIIFSVVFAFEYTAVARHYALALFLLAVLLANWRNRFRAPVLFAGGIALCASTNLLAWVCLGGLCTAVGYEIVARKLFSPRIAAAVLVAAFGFLLALAEIYNGRGGFGSPYVSRRGGALEGHVAERIRFAVESISHLTYLPAVLCLVCLMAAVFYFAWKSAPAFVCFLTCLALTAGLQIAGGFHSMRHLGFLLAGVVASCWIASSGDTKGFVWLSRLPGRIQSAIPMAAGCAAALLLAMQTAVLPFFVWCEVNYPFSHGRATARFIRDNIPPEVPMYCFTARSNTSVLPWLPGRRFFIFDRMEYGTFSKWGRVDAPSMQFMADYAAEHLLPEQRYALFVVAMNEEPNVFPSNMILLYDSRKNSPPVWGPYTEEFLVFAVVRPEFAESFRREPPRSETGAGGAD